MAESHTTPDWPRKHFVSDVMKVFEDLANDLQAEVDARYNGTQDQYPSIMKKYQRDIAPITDARRLLAEWGQYYVRP
jgi:hypothetical protein